MAAFRFRLSWIYGIGVIPLATGLGSAGWLAAAAMTPEPILPCADCAATRVVRFTMAALLHAQAAFWGVAYFAAMMSAWLTLRPRQLPRLFVVMAVVGGLASIGLLGIQALTSRACPLCLAVNLSSVVFSTIVLGLARHPKVWGRCASEAGADPQATGASATITEVEREFATTDERGRFAINLAASVFGVCLAGLNGIDGWSRWREREHEVQRIEELACAIAEAKQQPVHDPFGADRGDLKTAVRLEAYLSLHCPACALMCRELAELLKVHQGLDLEVHLLAPPEEVAQHHRRAAELARASRWGLAATRVLPREKALPLLEKLTSVKGQFGDVQLAQWCDELSLDAAEREALGREAASPGIAAALAEARHSFQQHGLTTTPAVVANGTVVAPPFRGPQLARLLARVDALRQTDARLAQHGQPVRR